MDVTKEAPATDLKRPREEDDNGAGATAASMETENSVNGDLTKEPACFSSVIPGWFSEMSPMWPGRLSSLRKSSFFGIVSVFPLFYSSILLSNFA